MGWQEDHNNKEASGWTIGGGEFSPTFWSPSAAGWQPEM